MIFADSLRKLLRLRVVLRVLLRFCSNLLIGVVLIFVQILFYFYAEANTAFNIESAELPYVGEHIALGDPISSLTAAAVGNYDASCVWGVVVYILFVYTSWVRWPHVLLSAVVSVIAFLPLYAGVVLSDFLTIPFMPGLVVAMLLPFPLTWLLCSITRWQYVRSYVRGSMALILAVLALVAIRFYIPALTVKYSDFVMIGAIAATLYLVCCFVVVSMVYALVKLVRLLLPRRARHGYVKDSLDNRRDDA